MATVQDINKIFVTSSIRLQDMKLQPITFGDGYLVDDNLVSLKDRVFVVDKNLENEINLYVDINGLTRYDWNITLSDGNRVLPSLDANGQRVANLNLPGIVNILFINGKKILETSSKKVSLGQQVTYNYKITQPTGTLKSSTITIIPAFKEYDIKNPAHVTLLSFSNASYGGKINDLPGWNPTEKTLNLTGYSSNNYIFFKSSKYPTALNYGTLPQTGLKKGDTYRVEDTGIVYTWDSYASTWNPDDHETKGWIIGSPYDQCDGEIISPKQIVPGSEYLYFNLDINNTVTIDYYTLGDETEHFAFDATPGIYEYHDRDRENHVLPILYDKRVYFDSPVNNLINNIRQGFFIREAEDKDEGNLMIINDTFESSYVNCITLFKFSKAYYSQRDYFIQVPEAKSILCYLSEYDLNKQFLPEILKIFQTVLLNEAHDTVKRLQQIRSVSKVDTYNLSKLIKLLGVTLNIYNMSSAEKRRLLEELTNFYKKVGTRESYDFYNLSTSHGQIGKLKQLFTPILDGIATDEKGTDTSNKRYVTFKSDEELGAKYFTEYIYPYTDYGDIGMLANSGESLLNVPHDEGKVQRPNKEITEGFPPVTDLAQSTPSYLGRYYIPTSEKFNFYCWHATNFDVLTLSETPLVGDSIWIYHYNHPYTTTIAGVAVNVTSPETVSHYPPVSDLFPMLVTAYDPISNTIRFEGKIFDKTYNESAVRNADNDKTSREVYLISKQIYHCWEAGTYKLGEITSIDQLPSSATNIGDYYVLNISPTPIRYIWTGEKWSTNRYYYTKLDDGAANENPYADPDRDKIQVGQIIYLRDSSGMHNEYDTIKTYDSSSHKISIKNGYVLTRNVSEDGWYEGYTDLIALTANNYVTDPKFGPNEPSIGYDYGTLTFYKGDVTSLSELPEVDNNIGDYFNLKSNGNTIAQYVWSGKEWVELEAETEDDGSITEEIKGQWVTYYQWDRPSKWYPTNHVQVSVDIPKETDYDTFMTEFKNTFYTIASTVLYVHSIQQIFNVGSVQNRSNRSSSTFNLISTPVYNTREYCVNNDRAIKPPFGIAQGDWLKSAMDWFETTAERDDWFNNLLKESSEKDLNGIYSAIGNRESKYSIQQWIYNITTEHGSWNEVLNN